MSRRSELRKLTLCVSGNPRKAAGSAHFVQWRLIQPPGKLNDGTKALNVKSTAAPEVKTMVRQL